MAVAEVPSDPQQARSIGGLDLEDRLRRRAHADVTAAIECEPVTVGEMPGVRQVEEKGRARIADEADAAAVAVEKSKCDRINHAVFRPLAAGMDSDSPPHPPAQ
jgi:hypothetical protein